MFGDETRHMRRKKRSHKRPGLYWWEDIYKGKHYRFYTRGKITLFVILAP
jgi:hypothetical protein